MLILFFPVHYFFYLTNLHRFSCELSTAAFLIVVLSKKDDFILSCVHASSPRKIKVFSTLQYLRVVQSCGSESHMFKLGYIRRGTAFDNNIESIQVKSK